MLILRLKAERYSSELYEVNENVKENDEVG